MTTRIVQLSDTHLLADADGTLWRVPTRETLRAVLDDVGRLEGGFDHLVLTGDLAQDEALETYQALGDLLGDWRSRCRLVPGNHDDREAIREAFADLVPAAGPLTFSFRAGAWRIIGLDTLVAGESGGRLDPAQLEWLAGQLAADADAPTLLFLHHPPTAIGVAWLDKMALAAPEAFVALVRRSPQIKVVCCGHVHQEFEGRIGGAALYATPSTALQLLRDDVQQPDLLPPGYRVLELDGPLWRTRVVRLATLEYPPDPDSA